MKPAKKACPYQVLKKDAVQANGLPRPSAPVLRSATTLIVTGRVMRGVERNAEMLSVSASATGIEIRGMTVEIGTRIVIGTTDGSGDAAEAEAAVAAVSVIEAETAIGGTELATWTGIGTATETETETEIETATGI